MSLKIGQLSRRHFLKNAAATAVALGGLRSLQLQAQVYAQDPVYGIDKVGQLLLDPAGILNLPRHFSYRVISRTGDRMSDGLITPSAPDGMAAFPVPGNPSQCILVRNHELASSSDEIDPFGGDRKLARKHVGDKAYDNHLLTMRPVNGGTSTLLFDHRSGRVERSHLSLIGTARNCAGGATPWGSWLTCEESLVGKLQGYGREHGYVFEVPSLSKGLVDAVPLKDMGRFMHEAAAVDSTSGIVYLSEDYERGLFYRFLPNVPGKLVQGGRLQALAIRGWPKANTRNWPEDSTDKHAQSVAINQRFECEWIDLEEVTSPDGDLKPKALRFSPAVKDWPLRCATITPAKSCLRQPAVAPIVLARSGATSQAPTKAPRAKRSSRALWSCCTRAITARYCRLATILSSPPGVI